MKYTMRKKKMMSSENILPYTCTYDCNSFSRNCFKARPHTNHQQFKIIKAKPENSIKKTKKRS